MPKFSTAIPQVLNLVLRTAVVLNSTKFSTKFSTESSRCILNLVVNLVTMLRIVGTTVGV